MPFQGYNPKLKIKNDTITDPKLYVMETSKGTRYQVMGPGTDGHTAQRIIKASTVPEVEKELGPAIPKAVKPRRKGAGKKAGKEKAPKKAGKKAAPKKAGKKKATAVDEMEEVPTVEEEVAMDEAPPKKAGKKAAPKKAATKAKAAPKEKAVPKAKASSVSIRGIETQVSDITRVANEMAYDDDEDDRVDKLVAIVGHANAIRDMLV